MSSNTRGSTDVDVETCHFCDETEVLQEHHIVPRQFDGGDEDVNLVDLCPTCHRKIEAMYDMRFYDELGVEKESDETEITERCFCNNCTATAHHELTCPEDGGKLHVCDSHKDCGIKSCDRRGVTPVRQNGHYNIFCDEHRSCAEDGCENTETKVYKSPKSDSPGEFKPFRVLCNHHAEATEPWIGDEWMEVWY